MEIKLYRPLIKGIKYKQFYFRLNTSFQTVLKCYEVFSDKLLTDYEKIEVCLWLLIKPKFVLHFFNPEQKTELFNTVFKNFIDVSGKRTSEEKHFDFTQDAGFIYSSFLQCYNIDLLKCGNKIHWHSFIALFNGLSDDTKIMQVISIRARPMPKATKYNVEERNQLIKLKQLYRLNLSEEERKKQFQEGLAKMALTLQGLAKK